MALPMSPTPHTLQVRHLALPNIAERNKPLPIRRKMTKVILDETALIAGVRKGVLKEWFSNANICIYVPLSTLERLSRLQRTMDRIGKDAREASKWLDEITTYNLDEYLVPLVPIPGVGNPPPVYLEGSNEHFETWAEVEKFLLKEPIPSTAESENDDKSNEFVEGKLSDLFLDDVSDDDSGGSHGSGGRRTRTSTPHVSRPSSTGQGLPTPSSPRPRAPSPQNVHPPIGTGRPSHKKTSSIDSNVSAPGTQSSQNSPGAAVPETLRSFFDHVLWRMHKDFSNQEGPASFVLLTNDVSKIAIARRFGIEAKRIEEMREQIAQEDRDYNRKLGERVVKREKPKAVAEMPTAKVGIATVHADKTPATARAKSPTVAAPVVSKATVKADVVLAANIPEDAASYNGDDSDGEVILHHSISPPLSPPKAPPLSPPTAPQAMRGPRHQNSRTQILDPNSFGRGVAHSSRSWRGRGGSNRGSPGNSHRGTPANGHRASSAGNHRAPPATSQPRERNPQRSPRVGLYTARRGGAQHQPTQAAPPDLSQPIDPNAFFTRSNARASGEARGGRRRLWEPI